MPTPGSLYIDAALPNVLAKRGPGAYIMDMVFPSMAVQKMTGFVWKSDATVEWLRAQDTLRAAGSRPNKVDNSDPTTLAYTIQDHALTGTLTDEERYQVEPALVSEIATVEGVQDRLRLKREIDGVAAIATSVTQTSSPTNKWNDAGGDIFADIKAQLSTVRAAFGVVPNALALDLDVLLKASESPAWRDRVKYTVSNQEERRLGMASILGDAVGIDPGNIFIASAYKNTATRGDTAAITNVWGENVLLFRKEPASLRYGGLGMQVRWAGSGGGTGYEVAVERDEAAKADLMHVHDYHQDLIINATAGYLFTNTLT